MKTIVLIDVDKTLIDDKYKLTADIRTTVKTTEQKCSVGLCSDSAIQSLRYWASEIGASGYLVGELGSLIYDARHDATTVINPDSTSWLTCLRDETILYLMKELPNITILIGDSVQFIRNRIQIPFVADNVVFINGYREESFGIHVRSFNPRTQELTCNPDYLSKIRQVVQSLSSKLSKIPITIDENQDYGIIIVHARKTSKKNGVSKLLSQTDAKRVFMIGDSMADYIDDHRVIHCSVGNASTDFKKKCQHGSQHHYTEGVRDILNQIN